MSLLFVVAASLAVFAAARPAPTTHRPASATPAAVSR
jgi:hypothetical protein